MSQSLTFKLAKQSLETIQSPTWRLEMASSLQIYLQKYLELHKSEENLGNKGFQEFLKASVWGASEEIKKEFPVISSSLKGRLGFMENILELKKQVIEMNEDMKSSDGSASFSPDTRYTFDLASKSSDEFAKLWKQVKYEIAQVRTASLPMKVFMPSDDGAKKLPILDMTSFTGGNQTIIVRLFTDETSDPTSLKYYTSNVFGIYQIRAQDGNLGATGGGLQNPFKITSEEANKILEAFKGQNFKDILDSIKFEEGKEHIENKEAAKVISNFVKNIGIKGKIPEPTLDGLLHMCDHLKNHKEHLNPLDLKMLLNFALDDLVLVDKEGVPLKDDEGKLLSYAKLFDARFNISHKYKEIVENTNLVAIDELDAKILENLNSNPADLKAKQGREREFFEENIVGHTLSTQETLKWLSSNQDGATTKEFNANGEKMPQAEQNDIMPAVNCGMENHATREDPLMAFSPAITHSPKCNIIKHNCESLAANIAYQKRLDFLNENYKAKSSANSECAGHRSIDLVNAALHGGCILNNKGEPVVVDGSCHEVGVGKKFQYAHEARVALKEIFSSIAESSLVKGPECASKSIEKAMAKLAEMGSKQGTIFDFEAMARKSYFPNEGFGPDARMDALAQELFGTEKVRKLCENNEINFVNFACDNLEAMQKVSLKVYFDSYPDHLEDYKMSVSAIHEIENAIAISSGEKWIQDNMEDDAVECLG